MDDIQFGKLVDEMEDNPSFPKALLETKLLQLSAEVIEFVTSVILKHEQEFYILVQKMFPDKLDDLLGSTGPSIISMITETTNKFYNNIYHKIQHKNESDLTNLVLKMSELGGYGPHILLDKLLRLTIEIHLDVSREELIIGNNNGDIDLKQFLDCNGEPLTAEEYLFDIYQKSILQQINMALNSKDLIHIMSKGPDDDSEFVNVPDGEYAFHIVIDKNVGSVLSDPHQPN